MNEAEKVPFGVVIPAFGHPKFLAEAIVSACEQKIDRPLRVVVVDDGCQFEETGETVSHLLPRYPGTLFYLRQENTRLPGARNAGIRFLLNLEPDILAIYLLDADNRLAPTSLDVYWRALEQNPEAGWAYPDISFFGVTRGENGFDTRETAPKYSQLKHLVSNISEAGSMVRTKVFHAGVMFDETMTSGFEDWEFWLSAQDAGYKGVRVEDTGFLYRGRPESMLADSKRSAARLVEKIRAKHKDLFDPQNIMSLEHMEAPACAVYVPEDEQFLFMSDPLAVPERVSLSEFTDRFHAWAHNPVEHFFPKHVAIIPKAVWEHLAAHKQYLRWWFWRVRESDKNLLFVKLENTGRVVFNHVPSEDFGNNSDLLIVASDVFEKRANGEVFDLKAGANGYAYLSIAEGALSGRNSVSSDSLTKTLEQISGLLMPHPAYVRHASKAYAGPDTRTVLKILYADICACKNREPFPVCSNKPHTIVTLNADLLSSRPALERLETLLEHLKKAGNEITVVLESYNAIETIQLIGAKYDWQKLVDSLVPLILPGDNLNYFLYLGNEYQRDLTAPASDDIAIVARTADRVIACGSPATIEALGEARQHGASGYVYFMPEFFLSKNDIEKGLAKLLAFEHAVTRVVTEETQFTNLLSAKGFPRSKFIETDKFLDRFQG